jgi:uncharacterized protein YqfA (UPF0365 family)
MRAKVEENRAHVIEAEAQIPLAISQAFRDGRLGIMDKRTAMKRSVPGR